jgi:hypothetical protein
VVQHFYSKVTEYNIFGERLASGGLLAMLTDTHPQTPEATLTT